MSYCKGCDDRERRIAQLEGLLAKMSRSKAELTRLSAVGSQLSEKLGTVLEFPKLSKRMGLENVAKVQMRTEI